MKPEETKLPKSVQDILDMVKETFDDEVTATVGDHFGSPSAHLEGTEAFMKKLTDKLMEKERNKLCKVELHTRDLEDLGFQDFLLKKGIATWAAGTEGPRMVKYTGTRAALTEMILDQFDDSDLLNDIEG